MKKNKIEHYSDKEALDFHTNDKSGKIEIVSSKPVIIGIRSKSCCIIVISSVPWL